MKTQTEYPETRHTSQTSEIIWLLLTRGSLTHDECEELTKELPCGKCTTLRSRIPEIRMKWGWPIVSRPESHGNGSHARYHMVFSYLAEDLAERNGVVQRTVRIAAIKWREKGMAFDSYAPFVEFLTKQYRFLVPKRQEELFKDLGIC